MRPLLPIIFLLFMTTSCGINVSVQDLTNPSIFDNQYQTKLISKSSSLIPNVGTPNSIKISASDDGRFLTFDTGDAIIGPGGVVRVYLLDTLTSEIELISRTETLLVNEDCESAYPVISGDGNKIIFYTCSQNLDLASGTITGNSDLVIYDRQTKDLKLIASQVDIENTAISYDGSKVIFITDLALVPGDVNTLEDVFLYNSIDESFEIVSVSTSGVQSADIIGKLSLSSNGRYAGFTANSQLDDDFPGGGGPMPFVRDLDEGTTTVLKGKTEVPTNRVSFTSLSGRSMSSNGRFVGFNSDFNSFVLQDLNNMTDVFLRDRNLNKNLLVSSSVSGSPGNGRSTLCSISTDGRYVVFVSSASDLVIGDLNSSQDIFVKDMLTGEVELASLATNGAQGNSDSNNCGGISADGRYVTFGTQATNFTTNDTNASYDLFLRDRVLGVTHLISVGLNGLPSGGAIYSQVSDDGRYVSFLSDSSQLVIGDTNSNRDVFIRDTFLGVTSRVSLNSAGTETSGGSGNFSMSSDGSRIVFESATGFLIDGISGSGVFLHHLATRVTQRIGKNLSGGAPNSDVYGGRLSPDGDQILFSSTASDLVTGDNVNTLNLFVYDIQSDSISKLPFETTSGQSWNCRCEFPYDINSDGNKVVFFSDDSFSLLDTNNLSDVYIFDSIKNELFLVSSHFESIAINADVESIHVTDNGDMLIETTASNIVDPKSDLDTNGVKDVYRFVYDSNVIDRLSVFFDENLGVPYPVSLGDVSNDGSIYQLFSDGKLMPDGADGLTNYLYTVNENILVGGIYFHWTYIRYSPTRSILKHSSVLLENGESYFYTDLIDGIVNDPKYGIYKIGSSGVATAVDIPIYQGIDSNSGALNPRLSYNGEHLVFESYSSNLVLNDTNNQSDIFVTNTTTGLIELISVNVSGASANESSSLPSISADGRFVAFSSAASNLVVGDTNNTTDIFVRDRQLGLTRRVSVDASGVESNFLSNSSTISDDGKKVCFLSDASNLHPDDLNGTTDVFIKDLETGAVDIVSKSTAGDLSNGQSSTAVISGNGQFVVFQSSASNLIPNDTNGMSDLFVRDLINNTTTRVVQNSYNPSISTDGRYITFTSQDSSLVSGDTNSLADVFLKDQVTNQIQRISVSSSGDEGLNGAQEHSISSDGRFVVFRSDSSNLVIGDSNDTSDVFLRDVIENKTTIVSLNDSLGSISGYSSGPAISGDGSKLSFVSSGANVVPLAFRGSNQIYLRGRK